MRYSTPIVLSIVLLTGILGILLTSCTKGLSTEEKLEDFSYLFETLWENHPYIELKSRVEGYNWLEHEKEFEDAVRASKNDREFAKVIQRMLLMLNNGHTSVLSPQTYDLITSLPAGMEPWREEAAKTNAKAVETWFMDAMSMVPQYPKGSTLPFRAMYCQGEYVVYWVGEDLASEKNVPLGSTVVRIDGLRVQGFVRTLRGSTVLRYDPVRGLLFQSQLSLPYRPESYGVEFRSPDGTIVRADIGPTKLTGSIQVPVLPANIRSMTGISTYMLADGQVAYVHIPQMIQYEESETWARELREFYATISDTKALIIDLRGNGGGDSRFWMLNVVSPLIARSITWRFTIAVKDGDYIRRFLAANLELHAENVRGSIEVIDRSRLESMLTEEQMRNLPPEVLGPGFGDLVLTETTIEPTGDIPYRGKVFLLVDQSVYSSAESFAVFCKATGWATVVGECTGGDGVGYTPVIAVLPNSGLALLFPVDMGLNPDFTANEEMHTIPDVLVERTPEDIVRLAKALAAGEGPVLPDPSYDPALRECLRLVDPDNQLPIYINKIRR